jgi:hypothetical protein
MAAPLIQISVLGRVQGSAQPFSAAVNGLVGGETVEYQVHIKMADIGTSNIQGTTTRTINSLTQAQATSGDGVNGLKVDLFNPAASPVQVTFGSLGTLNGDPSSLTNDAWDGGTGASAGTLGSSSIINIRPVHATGVQTAVTDELLYSGVFTVNANPGENGLVTMRWGSTSATGSAKINGGTTLLAPTATTEGGSDPMVGYTGLGLNVPEPGTLGLLGLGLVGGLIRRRRA